ncbi:hypothetical protein M9H77_07569 [Catharanthus roseus]|uniref:Uncharacterized protein n=1 Tax=Catharanthus roseus TaxID=4058 RepID=A0ACC0BVK8_CATRO|nr:hypothetical protein M9H77_07569 [Catharanthus roseus]
MLEYTALSIVGSGREGKAFTLQTTDGRFRPTVDCRFLDKKGLEQIHLPATDALKRKIEEFDGQGTPLKLITMRLIVKEQSREQFWVKINYVFERSHPTTDGRVALPSRVGFWMDGPVEDYTYCRCYKILNSGSSIKGGDLEKDSDRILQSKEDSYQSGIEATSN